MALVELVASCEGMEKKRLVCERAWYIPVVPTVNILWGVRGDVESVLSHIWGSCVSIGFPRSVFFIGACRVFVV